MIVFDTLHHVLHLTLSWIRHQKPQNRSSAFIETPQSISTPLGVASPYRRVDVNASLEDGIAKARKRQYVGRKCPRVGE